MKRFAKNTVSTIVGLGALAFLAAPAVAHGTGPGSFGQGQGMGMGMMGYGMGYGQNPGMMGPGMGYGQNPGMMGPGMGYGMMQGMGPGYGNNPGMGYAPCGQPANAVDKDLKPDDVKARMERWLAMQGNDRLKLGKIEEVDDNTITVEIVTVDDSLVRKMAVDRHSGLTQPAN